MSVRVNLKSKLFISSTLIMACIGLNAFKEFSVSDSEIARRKEIITKAYNYGFPLVLMEYSKKAMLTKTQTKANEFNHVSTFPDWKFRDVVRPNLDTYYSNAWLDLSNGPVVVTVPATKRYYLIPALDAYTNVFSSVGTRTTGTKAQKFVYTGPNWSGKVPKGMQQIKCPTNMVWLLGRIEVHNQKDGETIVADIQDEIYIKPLKCHRKVTYRSNSFSSEIYTAKEPPIDYVKNLSIEEFFTKMSYLMKINPPAKSDSVFIEELKEIDFEIGDGFSLGMFSDEEKEIYSNIPEEVQAKWDENSYGEQTKSWNFYKENIGNYGINYEHRAYISAIGLGANLPEDAVYPMTTVDKNLEDLNGEYNYVIHFAKEEIPSVNGFWSLTCYNNNDFLVHNELNRYAIGDRCNLKFNKDGSLDIYLQAQKPSNYTSINWLPIPEDATFSLVLRMYWPKKEVFKSNYQLPCVKKISN
ncbi:DUF1254 domain-containing protein [Flammeovirga pectinis]|uniref:DUF1254 domain-containing protein n=2 Tax=Flammeovirga pectinis TaxID=2494373 RepID=A0A3Q9FPM8_9BACT|nr:DUF1254 domain-containing protein [Flammeovirga pectinis]